MRSCAHYIRRHLALLPSYAVNLTVSSGEGWRRRRAQTEDGAPVQPSVGKIACVRPGATPCPLPSCGSLPQPGTGASFVALMIAQVFCSCQWAMCYNGVVEYAKREGGQTMDELGARVRGFRHARADRARWRTRRGSTPGSSRASSTGRPNGPATARSPTSRRPWESARPS